MSVRTATLDVAITLVVHLGREAVQEVPDAPVSVNGCTGAARTVTAAAGRPAGAGSASKMAVPHGYVGVLVGLLVVGVV
jgi:hypothetical protein